MMDATIAELQSMVDELKLPPTYYDHPVYRANSAGPPPIPLGLFIDAVPYSHKDSVIGFWMHNVFTGERYLWLVLRKSQLCRCGCRGWCTCYSMFNFAAWSIQCMGNGRSPSGRHDGSEWHSPGFDEVRAHLGGAALKHKYLMLYIKGDWAK